MFSNYKNFVTIRCYIKFLTSRNIYCSRTLHFWGVSYHQIYVNGGNRINMKLDSHNDLGFSRYLNNVFFGSLGFPLGPREPRSDRDRGRYPQWTPSIKQTLRFEPFQKQIKNIWKSWRKKIDNNEMRAIKKSSRIRIFFASPSHFSRKTSTGLARGGGLLVGAAVPWKTVGMTNNRKTWLARTRLYSQGHAQCQYVRFQCRLSPQTQ